MAKGFFVTGTDTGVGKTVITAALIKIAQLYGLSACGMKPIETGCSKQKFKTQNAKSKVQNRDLTPLDGTFLQSVGNTEESIDLITPVRYKNPLAPLPASEIERKPVDIKGIKKTYNILSGKYDAVIVEGIGGLLVPIAEDYFVLDLARDIGLPLIVVSKPGLGAINHTLLTVQYALGKGIDVAGVIINHPEPPAGTLAEATNPDIISRISPVPLLGIFPCLKNLKGTTIEKAAVKNLKREIIRKYLAG